MSSSNRVTPELRAKILADVRSGASKRQVARDHEIDEKSVRRIIIAAGTEKINPGVVYENKKIGGINWRDVIPAVNKMQELRGEASWSQKQATITVGDGKSPIGIFQFGDQHIGSIAADHRLFLEFTEIILNTKNLYVALLGDEVEMAIRLRGIAEICANVLDPFMQAEFVESWIEEISHKVLWSTWSNHSTEREEQATGNSIIRSILAKRVVFFNGIGHVDLNVGSQTYRIACSHKFKGTTANSPDAGCRRYMRLEYPEADIAMQGDIHRSSIAVYNEGNKIRCAMVSGTLQINSGFASRYFSLFTSSAMPVLALWPDKKQFVPFFSVQHYLDSLGYSNT